jgi:hypothetical protein
MHAIFNEKKLKQKEVSFKIKKKYHLKSNIMKMRKN